MCQSEALRAAILKGQLGNQFAYQNHNPQFPSTAALEVATKLLFE